MASFATALMGGLNGGAKAVGTVLDERRKENADNRKLDKVDAMQKRRDLRGEEFQIKLYGIKNKDGLVAAKLAVTNQRETNRQSAQMKNPEWKTSYDENGNAVQDLYHAGDKIKTRIGLKPSKGGNGNKGVKPTDWVAAGYDAYSENSYSAQRFSAVAELMEFKYPQAGKAAIGLEARNFVDDNPTATDEEIKEVVDAMPSNFWRDSEQQTQDKADMANQLKQRGRLIEPKQFDNAGAISAEQAKTSPDLYKKFMIQEGFSEASIEAGLAKNFASKAASPNSKNSAENVQAKAKPTPINEQQLLDKIAALDVKLSSLPKDKRHGRSLMSSPEKKRVYEQKKALEAELTNLKSKQRRDKNRQKIKQSRGY